MAQKIKMAFYLTPEEKAALDKRYGDDGSNSKTEFMENALRFYLDYLNAGSAGKLIPYALRSVLDGRLGMFEKRLSSHLFRLSVETEMGNRILSEITNLDEETLQKLRSKSIRSVRETNGELRFENLAREVEDDVWLD